MDELVLSVAGAVIVGGCARGQEGGFFGVVLVTDGEGGELGDAGGREREVVGILRGGGGVLDDDVDGDARVGLLEVDGADEVEVVPDLRGCEGAGEGLGGYEGLCEVGLGG